MESILSLLAHHPKLKDRIHDAQIMRILRQKWQSLPAPLSQHSHVLAIRSGTLSLGVYTAALKQELLFMKPTVLARCHQWCPDAGIQTLSIRVVKRPRRAKAIRFEKTRSLAETVALKNQARHNAGMQLCRTCRQCYSHDARCILCQLKKNIDLNTII